MSLVYNAEAYLTATFIPKDTMMVQPNIFMLRCMLKLITHAIYTYDNKNTLQVNKYSL